MAHTLSLGGEEIPGLPREPLDYLSTDERDTALETIRRVYTDIRTSVSYAVLARTSRESLAERVRQEAFRVLPFDSVIPEISDNEVLDVIATVDVTLARPPLPPLPQVNAEDLRSRDSVRRVFSSWEALVDLHKLTDPKWPCSYRDLATKLGYEAYELDILAESPCPHISLLLHYSKQGDPGPMTQTLIEATSQLHEDQPEAGWLGIQSAIDKALARSREATFPDHPLYIEQGPGENLANLLLLMCGLAMFAILIWCLSFWSLEPALYLPYFGVVALLAYATSVVSKASDTLNRAVFPNRREMWSILVHLEEPTLRPDYSLREYCHPPSKSAWDRRRRNLSILEPGYFGFSLVWIPLALLSCFVLMEDRAESMRFFLVALALAGTELCRTSTLFMLVRGAVDRTLTAVDIKALNDGFMGKLLVHGSLVHPVHFFKLFPIILFKPLYPSMILFGVFAATLRHTIVVYHFAEMNRANEIVLARVRSGEIKVHPWRQQDLSARIKDFWEPSIPTYIASVLSGLVTITMGFYNTNGHFGERESWDFDALDIVLLGLLCVIGIGESAYPVFLKRLLPKSNSNQDEVPPDDANDDGPVEENQI